MQPSDPSHAHAPVAPRASTRRRALVYGLGALLLTGAVAFAFTRPHLLLQARNFTASLRAVSLPQLILGLLAIYTGLLLRAPRWALLMPAEVRPPARMLIAPQIVGFTAIALFGRVADLARPYLVAKRTETPVAMQVAVYTVERALDLAATAVLFSVTLLFVPRTMPHHEAFTRAGVLASAATLALFGFGLVLRAFGGTLAATTRARLGRRFPKPANSVADRLLELQAGFATLRSLPQFAMCFGLSLVIWFGIALSYLFVAHSLPAVPQLAQLTLPSLLLLMATSMGASLLQLPVVGWLTQVAALSAAFHGFFGVPPAAASLCGLLTFSINTLGVIPWGLFLARRSGLSLRDARGAGKSPPDHAA